MRDTVRDSPPSHPVLLRGEHCIGAVIYGLIDPLEPDRIRYVGKTDRPGTRLSTHLDDALSRKKNVRASWITTVLVAGRYPVMLLLEECKLGCVGRELWWYEHFRAIGQADLNTAIPRHERDFRRRMPARNAVERAFIGVQRHVSNAGVAL